MKAVITVIGQDKVGILYNVAEVLAARNVNILDVNQTIMQGIFTMIMVVDLEGSSVPFEELQKVLDERGRSIDMSIRIQHEGIFNAMSEI